jgi:hypothetical protein
MLTSWPATSRWGIIVSQVAFPLNEPDTLGIEPSFDS